MTALIGILEADRGYGYDGAHECVKAYGIDNYKAPPRNKRSEGKQVLVGLGQRWIVESANAWLCAYGQLKRNTDRRQDHR